MSSISRSDVEDRGPRATAPESANGSAPGSAAQLSAANDAATHGSGDCAAPAPTPGKGSLVGDAHVLVVDDDARIRVLLKRYLSRSGFRVTEARDAAHAKNLIEALQFDMLIIDVMMPGEDGLSLTRAVRGGPPILLLTAQGDTESRIAGLEAGADDYLAKPFEPRELLLRMEAILRRALAAPPRERPKVARLGEAVFDIERGELKRGDEEIRLTTAEIALLRLLARRENEPVSRSELLDEVAPASEAGRAAQSGEERLVQERAIDVQITRLRKKIEENSRVPRYIKTVRGAGYMLTPDEADE